MSNNAAANVISMRDYDRPTATSSPPAASTQQAAQFDRLLRECEDLAVVRLGASVARMLDKAADALWALAEQTTDREQRDLFVKAKDKALGERRTIEEQFRSNYLTECRTRARRERSEGNQFARFDLSSLELGLVNDDDLEETLKVNEMAAKLRRYCEEELVALDQRVGVLVGDATLQGDGNPFSPQAIVTAFKLACRHVEPELRIRVVLLKLFDDHVLDDVRSIYRDMNALLVQRSILPKIRYGVKRNPVAPGVRLPGQAAGAAEATAAQIAGAALEAGYTGDATAADQDFFSTLQGLMANLAGGVRAGAVGAVPGGVGLGAPVAQIPGFPPIFGAPAAGAAPGSAAAPGIVPALQGAELLGSLTRIQHGDVSAVSAGNLPLAATLADPGTINVLRELKTTSLVGGMAQMDSMTLDIVAMLFDQIFDDRRIPSAMKALIGRLQIPVLKVAILDKTFFSKKHHPAREFLDALGEIALGLNADFTSEVPLYRALDTIVQKLIDDFNDRIELFQELHDEVRRVVAEETRRAEEEAQRIAAAIEQKEKLELAKAVAQEEIRQRAKIHTIPRAVLRFLVDHWVKLLLVAHAKHGAGSDAWKSAVETMDLLIWSVTSKQDLEERRKLAARLPGLLKRLNYGMQLVKVDDEARKRFFAKLMRCHTRVINGTIDQARARPAAPETAPVAGGPSATQTAAASAQDNLAIPQPAAAIPTLTDVAEPAPALIDPSPETRTVPDAASVAPATEVDDDIAPAQESPTFSAVTVQNPFGEGEIEVEEIDMSDIPALAGAPETTSTAGGDEHSRMAASLKAGAWVEFRDSEDNRVQAKLSYISPLKGTYLFINRQGRKIAEYSLYQLARELRCGNAQVMDGVPLIDRAMSSLVGVLRMTAPAH
jgi:hypothetical protein